MIQILSGRLQSRNVNPGGELTTYGGQQIIHFIGLVSESIIVSNVNLGNYEEI